MEENQTEEVQQGFSLTLDVGKFKTWTINLKCHILEEKLKNLDEFAKDKTEDQLVQIRRHQLGLAKVSIS